MKTSKIISVLLIFGLVFFSECQLTSKSSKEERQSKEHFISQMNDTLQLGYLQYLPEKYGKKNKEFPLLLFLHGAGERGSDLELVKMHGPPKLADSINFPFIIISPQCPSNQWWNIELLNEFLDFVISDLNVDQRRIYMTGLSMGGYGSWALGAAHPEKFAAIAPICGGGDTSTVANLVDIPVWNFHGAKDPVVPLSRSEVMVRNLKQAGGNVKFTVYPEATHDSWTETYNNQALFDWFLQNTKKN